MERKHLKESFSAHVRWCEHGAPVQGGQETKTVRFLHKPNLDKSDSQPLPTGLSLDTVLEA